MARSTRSNRRKRRKGSLSKAQARSYSQLVGSGANASANTPVDTSADVSAVEASKNKGASAPGAALRTSDTVDWANEYRQVFQDLRHLLVITAALFAVMIVLGFVI